MLVFACNVSLIHCRPCRSSVARKFPCERTRNFYSSHHSTCSLFLQKLCKNRACAVTFLKNGRTWENATFLCEYHLRENSGVSKGEYPLGSGFPIGASSIPVGTRFSVGKSSVLYLCGADGSRNCSTP